LAKLPKQIAVGSSKKFCLFEFPSVRVSAASLRCIDNDDPLTKQIAVSSSKKFCLFEFLYRELKQHNRFSICICKKANSTRSDNALQYLNNCALKKFYCLTLIPLK